MTQVRSDETTEEISETPSDYFTHKIEEAIDKLWKDNKIGDQTIEEWKSGHMRTSYRR